MDESVAEESADGEAHHEKNDALELRLTDPDERMADEREQAHQSDAGEAIGPDARRGFSSLLTGEQIADDFFYGVRRGLSEIGGARRRHGALNSPGPEHRAVVNADQLEIDQRADEFLRLAFPAKNLADEKRAGELAVARHAQRVVVVAGKRRKARVLVLR